MIDTYKRVHEYLSKLGMTTMECIIDKYVENLYDIPFMGILDHHLSEELKHKVSRKTESILDLKCLSEIETG